MSGNPVFELCRLSGLCDVSLKGFMEKVSINWAYFVLVGVKVVEFGQSYGASHAMLSRVISAMALVIS